MKYKYFGEGVKIKKGDQWLVNSRHWTWEDTIDHGKKSESEMIYRRPFTPSKPGKKKGGEK